MIFVLLALAAHATLPAAPPVPDGERLFRRCIACHALEPGRDSPSGPTLHAIVGRPVASREGFRYSDALRAYARRHPRWTEAELDRFLTDPLSAVPGSDMSFQGLDDPAHRHTLIRWLADPRARGD
jgi:cytochrome c